MTSLGRDLTLPDFEKFFLTEKLWSAFWPGRENFAAHILF